MVIFDTPTPMRTLSPMGTASSPGPNAVLLVEDRAELRPFLTEFLELAGFSVSEAGDGKEALALIEGQGSFWHGLLTDFDMPNMNGRELILEIVHRKIHFERMILMSGHGDIREKANDLLNLVPDLIILKKPFTGDQLVHLMTGPGAEK